MEIAGRFNPSSCLLRQLLASPRKVKGASRNTTHRSRIYEVKQGVTVCAQQEISMISQPKGRKGPNPAVRAGVIAAAIATMSCFGAAASFAGEGIAQPERLAVVQP